jgi:hypothetical protein
LIVEERIACSIAERKIWINGLLLLFHYIFCWWLPLQINKSPYGDGWLMKLTVSNKGELDGLMGADAYKQHQAANAHWEAPR